MFSTYNSNQVIEQQRAKQIIPSKFQWNYTASITFSVVPSAQKLVPSENCLNFVSNSKYTKMQGGNRKGNLKIIVPALYIKIGWVYSVLCWKIKSVNLVFPSSGNDKFKRALLLQKTGPGLKIIFCGISHVWILRSYKIGYGGQMHTNHFFTDLQPIRATNNLKPK